MTKLVALVPMKGHSERVPNKNLRPFNGRPLYHWVVEALLSSNSVEYVAINTDSEKIKEDLSKNFSQVKIVDRPKEIQGDFVSMNLIIEHDLKHLGIEHCLQTHSTNPLLTSQTVDSAAEKYFSSIPNFDSVFSVTRHQCRFYDKDGRPVNHNPDELLRTQDLPPLFEENSNFYIFSAESFFANQKKRIGLKPLMFEVSKAEALDIDEEVDFKIAQAVMRDLRG